MSQFPIQVNRKAIGMSQRKSFREVELVKYPFLALSETG
jgi:hypothetical protein